MPGVSRLFRPSPPSLVLLHRPFCQSCRPHLCPSHPLLTLLFDRHQEHQPPPICTCPPCVPTHAASAGPRLAVSWSLLPAVGQFHLNVSFGGQLDGLH
ncbi:hypothetical protein CABS03_13361 [Colletotrichum abscissum]|uniref:Uncharacterized protein n=1 Tax=Colletotrichum abscissum TaxID=1671311 RepID=A0A9P9XPE7_9PEZI|nr:hypothetical protein CABS02_02128 [Colletotrichum abscissum]